MGTPLISITRDNYKEKISDVLKSTAERSLKEIIDRKLSLYVQNSTNLGPLKLRLVEEGLLDYSDVDQLEAKGSEFEKWEFLYCKVLNKKVKRQVQYEKLFKALFDTSNEHIVVEIFEALTIKYVQPNQSSNLQPVGITTATIKVIERIAAVVVIMGLVVALVVTLTLINNSLSESKLLATVSNVNYNHVAPELQAPKLLPDGKPEEQPSNSALPPKPDVTIRLPQSTDTVEVHRDVSTSTLSSTWTVSDTRLTPPPKNKLSITIGNPADLSYFPGGTEIHLTLNDSTGAQWVDWFPQNASQVTSLKLVGVFTSLQIMHFLSVMENLTNLRIETLTGKICAKYIRAPTFTHDKLQHLQLTHVGNQHCASVYKFLTHRFEFPNLKRIDIANLPITQENEEFIVQFFTKYQPQLTHIDLRNVVVLLKSQAFGNLVFTNLTSLHSEFQNPNLEGAKLVFANLNRATPNLEEISSNVVCTPEQKCIFDKNWRKIDGKKTMICDVHNVLNSLPST
ncbi:unnamed protein product [Allacma fusca]|uniref:Uncharacterized protein n=1 Tax=Allacma fusca TaxID=39272 RepID=A0A8J2LFE9_9HEXA|nr:unnamed protein product [Allacma fusca]